MKIRKAILMCVAATALTTAPAWTAPFQASDSTKVVKKSRKAAKEATSATTPAVTEPTSAKSRHPAVSDSDIAAAKASGKVWVNTETGVYHKGGKWYGTTKQGKFMTEDEAMKAGYRASKTK